MPRRCGPLLSDRLAAVEKRLTDQGLVLAGEELVTPLLSLATVHAPLDYPQVEGVLEHGPHSLPRPPPAPLAHGLARFRYEKCNKNMTVGYSCKARGVCPSLSLLEEQPHKKRSAQDRGDYTHGDLRR